MKTNRKIAILAILFWGINYFVFGQDSNVLLEDSLITKSATQDITPQKKKLIMRELLQKADIYEKEEKNDSAIIAYEKILLIDTTFNKINFEIGRLWNKMGSQTVDTLKFEKSILYFEEYLSNFNIKSKQHPKGEKDSTKYYETRQYIISINEKNLSLKQQIRDIDKYDSLLKSYEGLWVSYFFSKNRMVPQWIFCIERDSISKTLSVELHKACNRFSDETPNQKVFPIIIEDGSLAFRLSKQQTFKPSQSEYYLKHLFVDLSNPTYALAIKNTTTKGKLDDNFPEDYIEQQKERDAKMHAQLEEQLKFEIDRARIEKTEEEFIIKPISESIMNVTCREIIANPVHKKGGVVIDTINCFFYKIPDDLTFIILGRLNYKFKNKEHTKHELKEIGFTQWNNRSITGNTFKHVGYLALCGGLTIANGYLGGGAFAWETYRLGVQLFGNYVTNVKSEELMRNPAKWNSIMYNNLLAYYNPEEKLSLESPVKEVEKKSKKRRKKEKKIKKEVTEDEESTDDIYFKPSQTK